MSRFRFQKVKSKSPDCGRCYSWHAACELRAYVKEDMEAGGIELCEHALLALLTEATAKVEKKIVAASTSLTKNIYIYLTCQSW